MDTYYKGTGLVVGHCWGGGYVIYPTERYYDWKYSDLIKKIKDGLSDGSIDSGFGFESTIAAGMIIQKIDNDGEWRRVKEYRRFFIADDCKGIAKMLKKDLSRELNTFRALKFQEGA